jgi:hypothetical protein
MRKDIQNKVIVNIDESWLDRMDYRRMSWSAVGKKNSSSIKALTPRISLMVALDTAGNVYYSLSQSNNNSQTMSVFFKELCSVLDAQRKGWRSKTVVLLDNAPYHTSNDTLQMF